MKMDLVISSYGTYIHKNGELFEIEIEDKKTKISPEKVKSIIIATHVQLTSDAVKLAVDNNIDILMLDEFGDPYGRFWHSKFGSTAFIRRRQIEVFESSEGISLAKRWILNKIEKSKEHLKDLEYKRTPKVQLIENNIIKIQECYDNIYQLEGEHIDELRNKIMLFEAQASKAYFDIISELIPEPYKFEGRSSRPAKDEYNCMLNYAFGVLYGKVEKCCIIAGLDPYIGILHTDNYNKKSLVFDFIENYRYLAWRTVFSMFSVKKVNKEFFDTIPDGMKLNKEGKKALLKEFIEVLDKKVEYNGREINNLDKIQHEFHELSNYLIKKEGN